MAPKRSPQALANIIRSHQIYWRKYGLGETFVMVEGGTDEDLWEEFCSKEDCTLFSADGKDNITAALDITNNDGLAGVAGIVDADYWLITESDKLQQENLLYDECYPDAELMILDSATLTDVLKPKFYLDDDPQIKILADLLQTEAELLAMEFGYFRLLNDCKSYCISFSEFWKSRRYAYDEFVDAEDIDSIQFRRDCFAEQLAEFHNAGRNRESGKWIEHGELLAGVAKLKDKDKFQMPNVKLCQGHETVAIIAYLLPILFKSEFGHNLPSSFKELCQRRKLEEKLREEYKEEYFVATKMHDCILNWQDANQCYRIIRDFSA